MVCGGHRSLLQGIAELMHLRCGGREFVGCVCVCVVPEQQKILRLQRKMFRNQETWKIWGERGQGGVGLFFSEGLFPSFSRVVCLLALCAYKVTRGGSHT